MNGSFYPKLAWEGIRKNRRLYTPYLLTCSGMILLFYMIHYLAALPALKAMPGGTSTTMVLGFGVWIMALFSLIFLVYTNSFLMRRRRKEFGLYNILGMGKRNLSLLLLWESGILLALSLSVGLFGGMMLSKLAELGLTWVLKGEISYDFTISLDSLQNTGFIFLLIFGIIYGKSLWQIWRMNTVSLLHSERTGEKPPRANCWLGIAGILLLGLAYYIAVSIQNPLIAMTWFFIAVALVIVATYLLFIAGSVMLCRLLQKNRRYYYQKNHFVSVSSMVYRMKRNGAGLASICILSTMVLVMLLGSGSLYFGIEDMLHTRYPRDFNLTANYLSGDETTQYTAEKAEAFLSDLNALLAESGTVPENMIHYVSAGVTGLLKDGNLTLDPNTVNAADMTTMDHVVQIFFVPLADYNRCMETSYSLAEDEILLHCVRWHYDNDTITTADGTIWQIQQQVDTFVDDGTASATLLPSVYLIVPDIEAAIAIANDELLPLGKGHACRAKLSVSFDADLPAEEEIAVTTVIAQHLRDREYSEASGYYYAYVEGREENRADFAGSVAGIFFLGVFLSLVFLLATVLLIYYKQVTEGYEDESRFAILQKLGMSRTDIRKSINSQMLTVFFLPLVTATVHLCFAFPIIQKLLMMFNLRNEMLSLAVMGVTVLVFGIIYTLIYRVTSNAYFAIVSETQENTAG